MTKNPTSSITERWYTLRYHPVQSALWNSTARFNVVPAGRRSGKTEICGKRKLVLKALKGSEFSDCRVFAGAPTRDQAKRIYWADLKKLVPQNLIAGKPIETQLCIPLVNGSEIHVLGLDKPERIEGTPWDFGVLDEYGNMKASTWREHVRPALADRNGGCDFIGVPEGRNHYYDLAKEAQADDSGIWGYYHWLSADILDPEEIEQAQRDLDELTYKQEFEGSFVMFAGMAYYNFNDNRNVGRWRKHYNTKQPLVFCLDFNESPGVAAIVQEVKHFHSGQVPLLNRTTTAVIGEVFIPRNSNTIRVCEKLIADWGEHKGHVFVYGDATGGAGGSAKVQGSDWALVRKVLGPHFGERLHIKVPKANPRERERVNSVNSRLWNMYNETYLCVDGSCTNVIKDFEGTRVIEGGTGEIDKRRDIMLTHITDAIGYYVHYEYPIVKYEASGQRYWK